MNHMRISGIELSSVILCQTKTKSRKYQGVSKVKSRVKTQIWEIWSEQLEHKQVPKRGRYQMSGRVSVPLLACHTRCTCSIETTRNSVKVKLDINVMKLVESLIGWEVIVTGQRSGSQRHRHFVGLFNVPVQAPTRDHPFYTVIPRNRPILSLFTPRWGYGGHILGFTPQTFH